MEFYDLPIRFFGSVESRDKIRQIATKEYNNFKPNIILIPAENETMQDHQAVSEEVVRTIKNTNIFGYEVIAHNKNVIPKMYVQISQKCIDTKIKALSCFKEQEKKFYFDKKLINSLATVRAAHAGFLGFAEAFDVYRIVQNNEET